MNNITQALKKPTLPEKVLNTQTLRTDKLRLIEDSQTIIDLCDGINNLHGENVKLREQNEKQEAAIQSLLQKVLVLENPVDESNKKEVS